MWKKRGGEDMGGFWAFGALRRGYTGWGVLLFSPWGGEKVLLFLFFFFQAEAA